MPKITRRHKRKVLVDWLPVLDLALRQGQFTLDALVQLYKTSKVVQALFSNFWISLEVVSGSIPLYVPDSATWSIFFRCFKAKAFFLPYNDTDTEVDVLVYSLVVHGHVKLAKEIAEKSGQQYREELHTAVLFNGSVAVQEAAILEFGIDPDELAHCMWIHEIPGLFHPPHDPNFIEANFYDDGALDCNAILEFITNIGELRSTVTLDFMSKLLTDRKIKGYIHPESLQDILFDEVQEIYLHTIKRTRKIYTQWDDPAAKRLLDTLIAPLYRKVCNAKA